MRVVKSVSLVLLLLFISFVTSRAQDPGDPCPDPDIPCEVPLDSWVIVFAIAAVTVAAIHLYRRQHAAFSK
ncbi:MAG: hypothetical protein EOP47_21815 [Sphingobacteriaceae bacterium]|nr:MAG: hypothetical protein EOP47_21815 [Sphingobacteriaceae bacterium]